MSIDNILRIVRIDSDAESALYALLEEVQRLSVQGGTASRLSVLFKDLKKAVKTYDNE